MKKFTFFIILFISSNAYACRPVAFDIKHWVKHASSINIGKVTSITIPDIEASYLGTLKDDEERIMVPFRYTFRAVNVKNIKGKSAKLYNFSKQCSFSAEMIGRDIIIFESSNDKRFIKSTKENLEKVNHELKI